jgi:ribosomal protein S18 acetylase RimI-like enzyme
MTTFFCGATNSGMTIKIQRIMGEYQAQAVETLTDAFSDDAIKRYFTSDAALRTRLARWILEGTVRYCITHGEVYITPGAEAAACWLPPGAADIHTWNALRAWRIIPSPLWTAGAQVLRAMIKVLSEGEQQHKRLMPRPHYYLWAIGTRRDAQGKGLGSALLSPMLERMDQEDMPAYLETQTEANVAFYQRRGFTVADERTHGTLRLWYMIREPR